MGGGGGNPGQTVVQSQTQGPPQFPVELQPYIKAIGQQALQTIGYPEMQLQPYLQGQHLQVPGLSPLGQLQQSQIAQRGQYGIPMPQGTTQASDIINSPAFSQFYSLPGQIGNTPAWQQAVTGIENEVAPKVQNAAAKAGLSQSGFEPKEIARAYARELVPLAQQAQQTSLQASNAAAQTLSQQIAQMQYQLPIQSLQELGSADTTQRNIQLAQSQAELDAFNRNLNIALSYLNPGQQSPVTPSGTSSTATTTAKTGGGWFAGK